MNKFFAGFVTGALVVGIGDTVEFRSMYGGSGGRRVPDSEDPVRLSAPAGLGAVASTRPGPDGVWRAPSGTFRAGDDDAIVTTAGQISLAIRLSYSNGYEQAFADVRKAAKGGSK